MFFLEKLNVNVFLCCCYNISFIKNKIQCNFKLVDRLFFRFSLDHLLVY